MNTRKVNLEDLVEIHKIETLSFRDGSYPLFVLRQFFDISEDFFIVAEDHGEILGYALGNLSIHTDQGWILSLGVNPAARGKGIGKSLMNALITLLEDANAKEICLTVHPENTRAVNIYKALAFEVVLESKNYYLDNDTRLLMKKKAISRQINS